MAICHRFLNILGDKEEDHREAVLKEDEQEVCVAQEDTVVGI